MGKWKTWRKSRCVCVFVIRSCMRDQGGRGDGGGKGVCVCVSECDVGKNWEGRGGVVYGMETVKLQPLRHTATDWNVLQHITLHCNAL